MRCKAGLTNQLLSYWHWGSRLPLSPSWLSHLISRMGLRLLGRLCSGVSHPPSFLSVFRWHTLWATYKRHKIGGEGLAIAEEVDVGWLTNTHYFQATVSLRKEQRVMTTNISSCHPFPKTR